MVNSDNVFANLKQSSFIVLLLCAAASLSISQPTYAQISEFKLLAPDGAEGDVFGKSVSISGDYAVVGAWNDDDNGSASGSAYMYTGFATATPTSPCDEVEGNCFWLEFSGSSVTYKEPTVFKTGSLTLLFFNNSSLAAAVNLVRHTGDETLQDMIDYIGQEPSTQHHPSWTQELGTWESVAPGERYIWEGFLQQGIHSIGCARLNPLGVWYGGGFTVEDSPVGVENEIAGLPAEFSLSQNYPNPFNPETVIRYSIPKAEEVSLVVYNLIGEKVAHLIDERKPAGNHQVTWDASNMASGNYLYRLQSGDFVLTRKMVLLK